VIKNTIVWGNTPSTPGIYNYISTPTVTYSCIQGGFTGTGNISTDPLFFNAGGGDFHLKSQAGRWTSGGWVTDGVTSLAIDAGDQADVYANEPEDNDDRINMGAYGNTSQASKSFAEAAPGAEAPIADEESEELVAPALVEEEVPENF
jgi:Disaggregatase related